MIVAQRRYLRKEAAIAAVINAALSVGFTVLMFGGMARVPVAGTGGLIVDSVPQSLMVAAMSTLVPTLLTRRRVAAGAIPSLATSDRLPRKAAVRALVVGALVAVLAGGTHALLLPLTGTAWPFAVVLGYKALYGALLGAGIAWWAARAALSFR